MHFYKLFLFMVFCVLMLPVLVIADTLKIRVVGMNEGGKEIILANIQEVKLKLKDTEKKKIAEEIKASLGGILDFTVSAIKPGEKVRVEVFANGWEILYPKDGVFYCPTDLANEIITVQMVTNQSRVDLDRIAGSFSHIGNKAVSNLQYYIQVLATQSRENAEQAQKTLINNSYRNTHYIYAQRADIPGMDELYKVIVGPYALRKEAEDALAKLDELGAFTKPFIILR